MNNQRDIAIIGMSGVFPEANDLNQFYLNLCNGLDSVRDMPEERRASTGLDREKNYILCGYLNRIDEFDHKFFNISLREAEYMDPQQRFALELSCAAIENAGYSLKRFRGSRTSVSLAAIQNDYSTLLNLSDGTALVGNIMASIAGKVSYYLDLHGPAMMIDTSCSSSLVTIHDACSRILAGEVDYALAGGINLYVFFPERENFLDPLGIASPDGKSKAFDAAANGTGIGEGAGIVLLKPLEKALEDGDNIHAVIKASAINQDGGRSNGVASPSPCAQTEVITQTWRKANIDPLTISYVEAHGTGTYVGDPIEIQGLTDAFRQFTDKKQFCAIGSVKTNLGHLGAAAGISGLIKNVLALKYRKLFPSLHFSQPNPHINFANTPLYVHTAQSEWPAENRVRRATVSSFGISGTNAHVLLEEAPSRSAGDSLIEEHPDYLVTLSAKTAQALKDYARAFSDYLRTTDDHLSDISYVLNAGRDDYAWRFAGVVNSREGLIGNLAQVVDGDLTFKTGAPSKPETSVIFLCSGDVEIKSGVVAKLREQFEVFNAAWDSCHQIIGDVTSGSKAETFIVQYSLSRLWEAAGLAAKHVWGTGVGNLLVGVMTGKLSLKEGLQRAVSYQETTAPFNPGKFRNVLDNQLEKEATVFVELGNRGTLSTTVREARGAAVPVVSLDSYCSRSGLLQTLANLYVRNVSIDWSRFYEKSGGRHIELPTYPFERVRCWVEVDSSKAMQSANLVAEEKREEKREETGGGPLLTGENITETERQLALIWGEVLKVDTLGCDDDYFDLGGNSLSGAQVQSRISERLDIEVEFEAIYDYSTLREFAAYLDTRKSSTNGGGAHNEPEAQESSIPRVQRADEYALSYAQERLFNLYQMEPDSPFYNMPGAFRLKGSLRRDALEQTLNEILRRHEILRTTYKISDERAAQCISATKSVPCSFVSLKHLPAMEREAAASRLAAEEAARPFNLTSEIPLRVTLLELSGDEHVLLLTMHHIASDGWSIGIFFEEFSELYRAYAKGISPSLPELPIQYVDYADWQRNWLNGARWETQLDFWKDQLRGVPPLLALPTDRIRPSRQTFRGAVSTHEFPLALTESLNQLSRQEGVTLFMTLLAAFNVLLYRYSGQTDICVGSPVANRARVETERLIGFFANTLALRNDLSGNPGFWEFLQRVKGATLKAYAHQDMPFEKLVQSLQPERNPGYSPIFQVVFVLQNSPLQALELPDLALSLLETDSKAAKFDLTLSLTEDAGGLIGTMEYSTELFNADTISRMFRNYQILLESIVASPSQSVAVLPLLTDEERHQMLVVWNNSEAADLYDFG